MSSISGLFRESELFEVIVSRSGLFRSHVYKVRAASTSCLQGQDCLEVMFLKSGKHRGHIFKVRLV